MVKEIISNELSTSPSCLGYRQLSKFINIKYNLTVSKEQLRKCPNPFVPNASFLYPLETSENRKIFWCFQGVEKGYIGNKWIKVVDPDGVRERLKKLIPEVNYVLKFWGWTVVTRTCIVRIYRFFSQETQWICSKMESRNI